LLLQSYKLCKYIENVYPFAVHVVTFTFHYQLMHTKHFHNFHLKLYTLKMFVMRTKTNLKNPTCFDRFADHHQGLVPVPCTITTCQFFLLLRIPVMWRYVFCNIQHPYYSFRNVVIWDIDYYTRVVIWDIDYYTRGCVAYLYVCACAVLVGVVSGCVLSFLFCGSCARS